MNKEAGTNREAVWAGKLHRRQVTQESTMASSQLAAGERNPFVLLAAKLTTV